MFTELANTCKSMVAKRSAKDIL